MMRATPATSANNSSSSITIRASLLTPTGRQQSLVLGSSPSKSESNSSNRHDESNDGVIATDQIQEPQYETTSQHLNAFCFFKDSSSLDMEMKEIIEELLKDQELTKKSMAAPTSSAPHQMQVRVTFYTTHNPQSVLMILKNDQALQQISEKAQELFPAAEYRLYYGDVNGPIYEFTDSEQVMSKIRITSFSRTPQLFVRLESAPPAKKSSKGERESKSSASLKRIEQNQESTLKNLEKLQNAVERLSGLESKIASIQAVDQKQSAPAEKVNRPFPPAKHSASCDACLGDIIGHRYKCLECADYDLCEQCEKKSVHYEHALIRIVHPSKTAIPSYVTRNSPKNVFPAYMQNRNSCGFRENDPAYIKARDHVYKQVFNYAPPTPVVSQSTVPTAAPVPNPTTAPAAAPAPAQNKTTGLESNLFNEETRAALVNSAAFVKDALNICSKSFIDMAEGFQTSTGKTVIDRPTMELGVKKMEEKVDNLKRHCEEKYFGAAPQAAEKVAEPSKKAPESSTGPKIKKAKKKTVYKKTAEKLSSSSLAAAAADEQLREAKRRADASTAELQRKLAELNFKPLEEELRSEQVTVTPAETYNSLEAIMRAILAPHNVVPPTTPAEPSEPIVPTPVAASAPLLFDPTWGDFINVEVPQQQPQEQEQQNQEANDDDLLEFSDVAEAPAPVAVPEQEASLPAYNDETEKTFDRLLEMGFDYNVVVAAIKANGSNLENCLAYLLQ
ncbi:hypothetical protein CAEBREN_02803 [Caenorhabditis brenneri]|uniref:Uncharacterized protein n=1 Tax=Caenorhabditis brenneri TaxID=135651 RepID=G0NYK5_CAEBE|nr:hypothetical protein CAEBREN_02803 [Caenorhabditis brenneri]